MPEKLMELHLILIDPLNSEAAKTPVAKGGPEGQGPQLFMHEMLLSILQSSGQRKEAHPTPPPPPPAYLVVDQW